MYYTVSAETSKEAEVKKKSFTGKKRRLSASDGFNKIDKALETFMTYQQQADRRFLKAEEERERKRKKGMRNDEKKIRTFS